MKKITGQQGAELAQLLKSWFDENLPTTKMELLKPIDMPGLDAHPTDSEVVDTECVTKEDIQKAIAQKRVTLPAGLMPEDLEQKLMVGTRVTEPLLNSGMIRQDGVETSMSTVNFFHATKLELAAKKEMGGGAAMSMSGEGISNPRQPKPYSPNIRPGENN